MPFKKGCAKIGGKKKGSQNKVTREIKDMIRQALDECGGVKYLKEQACKNPGSFFTLVSKIIPAEIKNEITGKNGGPIETKTLNPEDKTIINQYLKEKKNEL